MKKGTFKIKVFQYGHDPEVHFIDKEGYLLGGGLFGLDRRTTPTGRNGKDEHVWYVAHLPTGYELWECDTRAQGVRFVRELLAQEVTVPWTSEDPIALQANKDQVQEARRRTRLAVPSRNYPAFKTNWRWA